MANCTVSQLYMPWMLIASAGTAVVFVPAGPWVSASGVTGARGWGEMRNRNGNVQAVPAVQFTNDVHDPGTSSTAVGATIASDTVSDPNGVTTVSTGAYRFARPGFNVNLAPAGSLATASVSGVIELIRQ